MISSLCSRPGEKVVVMDVEELSSQDSDADGDVEQTGVIIWNCNKGDGIQSKRLMSATECTQ